MAVPLWRLKFDELSWEERQRICAESEKVLEQVGEAVLFKTKKTGDSARGFNAVAQAIAALSYAPGGITIFGHHWGEDL